MRENFIPNRFLSLPPDASPPRGAAGTLIYDGSYLDGIGEIGLSRVSSSNALFQPTTPTSSAFPGPGQTAVTVVTRVGRYHTQICWSGYIPHNIQTPE